MQFLLDNKFMNQCYIFLNSCSLSTTSNILLKTDAIVVFIHCGKGSMSSSFENMLCFPY